MAEEEKKIKDAVSEANPSKFMGLRAPEEQGQGLDIPQHQAVRPRDMDLAFRCPL